ncbi:hypothetical protein C7M84_007141 [Penaeus vannamei]|uniref:Uncharacterized protein n=1 Tax=Penaeus vannamei TaxID=6689 RepID=A0A3R7P3E3_PENVA|nr:hypothetical protein C7M84_007141 [Penaeus vannamei]
MLILALIGVAATAPTFHGPRSTRSHGGRRGGAGASASDASCRGSARSTGLRTRCCGRRRTIAGRGEQQEHVRQPNGNVICRIPSLPSASKACPPPTPVPGREAPQGLLATSRHAPPGGAHPHRVFSSAFLREIGDYSATIYSSPSSVCDRTALASKILSPAKRIPRATPLPSSSSIFPPIASRPWEVTSLPPPPSFSVNIQQEASGAPLRDRCHPRFPPLSASLNVTMIPHARSQIIRKQEQRERSGLAKDPDPKLRPQDQPKTPTPTTTTKTQPQASRPAKTPTPATTHYDFKTSQELKPQPRATTSSTTSRQPKTPTQATTSRQQDPQPQAMTFKTSQRPQPQATTQDSQDPNPSYDLKTSQRPQPKLRPQRRPKTPTQATTSRPAKDPNPKTSRPARPTQARSAKDPNQATRQSQRPQPQLDQPKTQPQATTQDQPRPQPKLRLKTAKDPTQAMTSRPAKDPNPKLRPQQNPKDPTKLRLKTSQRPQPQATTSRPAKDPTQAYSTQRPQSDRSQSQPKLRLSYDKSQRAKTCKDPPSYDYKTLGNVSRHERHPSPLRLS